VNHAKRYKDQPLPKSMDVLKTGAGTRERYMPGDPQAEEGAVAVETTRLKEQKPTDVL